MSLHATSPSSQTVAALQREAKTLRRDHRRALEDHQQEIEDLRRNLRRAEEDKQQEIEILKRALRRAEEDKWQAEVDLEDQLLTCQPLSRGKGTGNPDMSRHEQQGNPISTPKLEESQIPVGRNKQQVPRPLGLEDSDAGPTLSLTASVSTVDTKHKKRLCPWDSPAPEKVGRSLQDCTSAPQDNPLYRDYTGEKAREKARKLLGNLPKLSPEEIAARDEKQYQEARARQAERQRREQLGELISDEDYWMLDISSYTPNFWLQKSQLGT